MQRDYEKVGGEGSSSSPSISQQKMGMLLGFLVGLLVTGIVLAIYIPLTDESKSERWEKEVDQYVASMSSRRIMTHLKELEKIANNNGDTRAAGTPGYSDSVDYIVSQLNKYAKCDPGPQTQTFTFEDWESLSDPKLSQVSPAAVDYTDFKILDFSGTGTAVGEIVIPTGDPLGCDEIDWEDGDANKKIALVQRGECPLADKAENAARAGAIGVLIFASGSAGDTGAFSASLGTNQSVPVFSIPFDLGEEFTQELPTMSMFADTNTFDVETWNVLCPGKKGNKDKTIIVGAHLDSVPEGPGINDDGSGTSTILELAIQMADSDLEIHNRVTFGWWGAEEVGLKGSAHFVDAALQSGQITEIAANLNFDMIASPNYVMGILNGSSAEDPDVKHGCAEIQGLFEDYFEFEDIPYVAQPNFDPPRSDYGPFLVVKIPAGGLFTGAEVFKTAEQRTTFGGFPEASYDTCYHKYCDTTENIDLLALQNNAEAAAYVLGVMSVNQNLDAMLLPPEQQKRSVGSKKIARAMDGAHLRARANKFPDRPLF
eukprot:CAMPEP_0201493214 /NCGR_PEP_ID=MMETSP0151_2-20130828/36279_1 /ASSEMBLY_ACC=CAM_ASM_000257 /TAXON_ID=200890 /ORGANISM="Paramoeba atlantica, Strain 621/1 / CCAP 1560/9" /LENGTH=541 /DNA_ID=CAMNT_0047880423 /DNA_START=74 /DNA_END=1699 /DNA_ORIENTATION=-